MTRHLSLLCAATFVVPFTFVTHSAQACSCREPLPLLLSPSSSSLGKIPRNARVRVALPSYVQGRLVLRKHLGTEVAVKRIDSPLQRVTHAELIPEKQLDADTRYEVAVIRPEHHPSIYVFGTFVTGTTADTTPPTAPKIERAIVNAPSSASAMGSCAVYSPWAEVFASGARDPDREDASLLYAVWTSNDRGVVDLNAPPTAYLIEKNGKIKLGKTSYCDPDEFPLPTQGTIKIAMAAIDEAGNRSAVQRIGLVMPTPLEAKP